MSAQQGNFQLFTNLIADFYKKRSSKDKCVDFMAAVCWTNK